MLYDKYKSIVARLASVVNWIKRFRVLVLTLIGVAVACTATGMAVNGLVYDKVDCPTSVEYGQTLGYKANALFEDVYYEYCEKGSSAWTKEAPRVVGEYQVRAVSRRVFGAKSYGDVHTFTIAPKSVEVYVSQDTIEYGKTPAVTAKLIGKDTITCDKMSYKDLDNQAVSKVTPVKENIRVTDENGNDVTASYEFVPVERDIAFTARTVEVTLAGLEVIYDGTPYGTDEYEITDGALAFDDALTFAFDKTVTEVGTEQNTANVSVFTQDGVEVTHQYYVVIKCGDLVVNKRPVTLVTSTESFVYNGKPNAGYSCVVQKESEYGLAKGHTLVRDEQVDCTLKEVGTKENVLAYLIKDANGKDVTANYDISYEYGELKVINRDVTLITESKTFVYNGADNANNACTVKTGETATYALCEGHTLVRDEETNTFIENVGSAQNKLAYFIKDEDGNDVTDCYTIAYEYGTLEVVARTIKVQTATSTHVYDGEVYTDDTFDYADSSEYKLVEGHEWKRVGDLVSVQYVEETPKENKFGIIVYEGEEDKSANYDIEYEYGTIAITPLAIQFTVKDETKVYDGTPLKASDYTLSQELIGEDMPTVRYYGMITEVGEAESGIFVDEIHNGERDVTSCYAITRNAGTLTVTERPLKVTTGSRSWVYDGKTHSYVDGTTAEGLLEAHTLVFNGAMGATDVSEVARENGNVVGIDNKYEVWVVSEDGTKDYTGNYKIEYVYGKLTIEPLSIKIKTSTSTHEYDGKAYSDGTFDYADDTPNCVVSGHELKVVGDIASVRFVESAPTANAFLVGVFKGIEDKTDNYAIDYDFGAISITPRKVTFTVANEVRVYNGKPQCSTEYTSEGLCSGDKPTVSFKDELTDVGKIDSEIVVEKIVNNNRDITASYDITCVKGTLEIAHRHISVKTASQSFTYDGMAHSAPWLDWNSELIDGHEIEVNTDYTQITELETVANEFTVTIKNGVTPVTHNYAIEYVCGELTVAPRRITIGSQSVAKTYDGMPLIAPDYTIYLVDDCVDLLEGHYVCNAPIATGTQTDKGSSVNTFDVDLEALRVSDMYGNDVTKYYSFVDKIEGTLTVTARSITVRTNDETWVYDGEEHQNLETYVVDYINVDGDELVLDHNFVITSYPTIVNVGSRPNTQEIRIFNGLRADVTQNYELYYQVGTLTVTKRPIIITTGDGTWIYDGKEHYNNAETNVWDLGEQDYGLIAGHTYIVNDDYSKICDYGTKVNKNTITILSSSGFVTDNYDISYMYGTLRVEKRQVLINTGSYSWIYDDTWHAYTQAEAVTGENGQNDLVDGDRCEIDIYRGISQFQDVGSYSNIYEVDIFNNQGINVSNNYDISYEHGILEIKHRPISIQTQDGEWIYDGREHYNDQASIKGIVDGHEYVLYSYTTIINKGEAHNEHYEWDIYSMDGRIVTYNYEVTQISLGTLRIVPRLVCVWTQSDTFTYDGTAHSNTTVWADNLANRHFLYAESDYTQVTELGTVDNIVKVAIRNNYSQDVTSNYEIEYVNGTLTVNPRQVDIIATDLEKVYDGTPLIGDYFMEGDGLLGGHTFATPIPNDGLLTDVGVQDYSLLFDIDELIVVDQDGNDVTRYYVFTAQKEATLTITPRKLFLETGSNQWVYDGIEHYEDAVYVQTTLEKHGLVDGHVIYVTEHTTITKVGKIANELRFTILSGNENVTRNYLIYTKQGELTVTPRPICITTSSVEKKYDGKALKSETVIIEGLLETDKFDKEVKANGSRTQVGSSDNTLNVDVSTIRILNERGEDVTDQYEEIRVQLGKLTVKVSQTGDLIGLNGSLEGKNDKESIEEQVNKELFSFTVERDGTVYFRIKSYGDYSFNGWEEATVYEMDDLTISPLYFVSIALAEAGYDLSAITINDIHGQMYRMLPYFAQANKEEALSDIMLTQEDWTSYTLYTYAYEYMLNHNLSLAGTPYEAMELAYREFVYANYLTLPLSTKTAMEDVIMREGLNVKSRTLVYDVANLVRGYLPYDLYCEEYEGDYAVYFFEEASSALCRYYATAAVALYRTLGIPARYVEGYVGEGIMGMTNVVTADKGHAWVEIYVDGLGWIPMEVTGSDGQGPIVIGGGGGGGGGKITPKILLKPVNVEQKYDPSNPTVYAKNELDPLELEEYLAQGYTYEVEITGEQTGIGYTKTRIVEQTFVFYDKYGTDVTDEFIWEFETGLITVYGDFYVEIYGFEFTYDATLRRYVDYETAGIPWYEIHCPEDYEISFDASNIGMRDAGILDMTDFYSMPITIKYKGEVLTEDVPKIMFIGEPMRIAKRDIFVVTGSATAEYVEGIILTDDSAEIVKGELCEGDKLVVDIVGKQEDVGESPNSFSALYIENQDGENVTHNYEVSYKYGILKVQ